MYFIYILQSQKDQSYYIGFSADPQERLNQHNKASTGYTSKKKPWTIVYQEEYPSKKEALDREKFIKLKKSKVFIQKLINTRSADFSHSN
ncbi:GIY-YIG nuclease family protein [Emticicia sp. CRIBPO]|uniref:GIY-YIG nuclease family protein n=1 Tax=Emticicia sp. CRIBPO TaxID=2683258 RepID=UPI0014129D4D|nr:GIY-YIG nuclease family protein [Emticicia sp. CRIBPO]NBA88890.1 GIY-YIG nuclease family protein [Emticicia sp. CRIBPO]